MVLPISALDIFIDARFKTSIGILIIVSTSISSYFFQQLIMDEEFTLLATPTSLPVLPTLFPIATVTNMSTSAAFYLVITVRATKPT